MQAMGWRVRRLDDGAIDYGFYRAEAAEVVGGYFFLTVAYLDEATEIAKQCPGLPIGLTVEVRPVAATSPMLADVPGRPVRG